MSTTADVIQNHLSSFAAGNLEGLMADYTEDSVLFTPQGMLRGPAAIRGFMSGLFAEFRKPGSSFRLGTQQVADEVAYIVWSAETAENSYELATDTFVVRGGRILQQSFAGKIVRKS